MDKEKYNQIISDAYQNYRKIEFERIMSQKHGEYLMGKEEFINQIKTDKEFSEKWGLKIEKRELSWVERYEIHKKYIAEDKLDLLFELADNENLSKLGVPTKLITLAYNNETIEVYE